MPWTLKTQVVLYIWPLIFGTVHSILCYRSQVWATQFNTSFSQTYTAPEENLTYLCMDQHLNTLRISLHSTIQTIQKHILSYVDCEFTKKGDNKLTWSEELWPIPLYFLNSTFEQNEVKTPFDISPNSHGTTGSASPTMQNVLLSVFIKKKVERQLV